MDDQFSFEFLGKCAVPATSRFARWNSTIVPTLVAQPSRRVVTSLPLKWCVASELSSRKILADESNTRQLLFIDRPHYVGNVIALRFSQTDPHALSAKRTIR